MTLAGVVKEDLACPGSSLPKKPQKIKININRKAASSQACKISSWVGPPGLLKEPPSPATVQVYRII